MIPDGKRNDCFLVYDYTTDRDTYDAEAGKYAFEAVTAGFGTSFWPTWTLT